MRKLALYCLAAVLIAATGTTFLIWDDLSVFTQELLATVAATVFGGSAFTCWLFGSVGDSRGKS